jgi:amidase
MDRRTFIGTAALAGTGAALAGKTGLAAAKEFELAEATIDDLRAAMAKGEMTSRSITRKYLDHIREIDGRIRSMIEINPVAIEIAERLDAERKSGRVRGPLHGIPIVVKDNIDTADRMKTTAGSLALLNDPAPAADAFIVRQLRDAGAVIIGKTNLSEWANFRSTSSVSGWSARGGQTRSPYVLDRNACGSSSGTGTAIAANLAAVGIGTETDGSIVCPSSICSLVGLKPTVGLVSRSGIIPISHTQDTAGPMTRTVRDAAIVLAAITAADPADAAMAQSPRGKVEDHAAMLSSDGLKGTRIGVARDFWGKRSDVDKAMDEALAAIKDAGATLVDVKFPTLAKFGDPEFEVLLFEFKDGLAKYLAGRNATHRTLEELIQFNIDNAGREMPYFGQEIFELAVKKGPLTTPAYRTALRSCRALTRTQGIDLAMMRNRLNAIVAPSNAPTWKIDLVNGDCGSSYISSSSLPAVAGYPNITVPAGFIGELPVGVSFFGKPWSEGALLRIAYAFEQATKARRAPKFLTTLDA